MVKISVLTSYYNAEDFIRDSIESILTQSYENFEYLLVDDGSTDKSSQITKKYANRDDRIRIIQKKNTGLTDSLNVALQHASGEWIARLDADDIALPNRLRDQLNFVEINNCVSLLGGGCIEIDNTGMNVKKHKYPTDHNILINKLRDPNNKFFPHSSAFFNRQVAVDLGGYNPRFSRSQDWDLWLRIGETGKIACLNVPVVKLRKHASMLSNSESGRLQSLMGMCAVICHLRRKEGLSDPSLIDENSWKGFLDWLEKQLAGEGIFQQRKTWQAIRNAYYSHKGNKLERAKAVATYLIKNPVSLKALWQHFFKPDYALKLSKESEIYGTREHG